MSAAEYAGLEEEMLEANMKILYREEGMDCLE